MYIKSSVFCGTRTLLDKSLKVLEISTHLSDLFANR